MKSYPPLLFAVETETGWMAVFCELTHDRRGWAAAIGEAVKAKESPAQPHLVNPTAGAGSPFPVREGCGQIGRRVGCGWGLKYMGGA